MSSDYDRMRATALVADVSGGAALAGAITTAVLYLSRGGGTAETTTGVTDVAWRGTGFRLEGRF